MAIRRRSLLAAGPLLLVPSHLASGIDSSSMGDFPEFTERSRASIDKGTKWMLKTFNRDNVTRVDLREEQAPVAPTVLANLTAPILRTIAERLAREGRSPRGMVCSGALVSEVDEIAGLLGGCGLRERRRRFLGDWAALLLSTA